MVSPICLSSQHYATGDTKSPAILTGKMWKRGVVEYETSNAT
jgi:hypothetical protein